MSPLTTVPSALSLLHFPSTSIPSTRDTLLQELAPVNLSPTSLGYTGDSEDLSAVINFLTHTALAHRLLAHRYAASQPLPASDDVALTRSISHMLQTLNQTASPVPGNCAALCAVIKGIAAGLEKRVGKEEVDNVFGGVLVQRGELAEKEELCERVLERMREEQRLRMGLVRHRFQVCREAFGIDERIGEVESKEVGMFEVLGARGWVLRWGRMEGVGGVREVIMGEVPDRGGRVGERGMPGFKERERGVRSESGSGRGSGSGSGRGGRRGGKGGKRKKKR